MLHIRHLSKVVALCLLLPCITANTASSQTRISEKWKRPGFFFAAGADLANSRIINNATGSSPDRIRGKEFSTSGFIEAGYFFSEKLGFLTGFRYHSTFSSYSSTSDYYNQYFTMDVENDPYELIVTGTDIGGIQKIDLLSFPVSVVRRFPLNEKTAITLQPAVQLFVPLGNSFRNGGSFTKKGYFPAYNVLLENLPEYGFENDVYMESVGKAELNPISFGAYISAGIDYLVTKRIQLVFAGFHNRSLTSISNYSSPDELLTSESSQLDGSLRGSIETKLKSTGISFTLRYFLTDFRKFKYYFHLTPEQNLKEYERLHNIFRY
jgi:hypothetical protein